MIRRHSRACMALVSLVLSACASVPPQPSVEDPDAAWNDRTQALYAIENWEVKGKLAVRTSKRGGQANLVWQRDGEDHNINLYGPLGSGRVILTSDATGAVLQDNKRQTYTATSAEELLYRVAGWQVPFKSLQYWLLGVPSPEEDYEQSLDARGRLNTLRQSGWEIEFTDYRDFDGRELPRKFEMRALPEMVHIVNDALHESDQVQVKVIIKRWQI